MRRTPSETYPPDPRRTPLYEAWQQARDLFHAHGFDPSRYDDVRAARRAYLASVGR